MLPLGASFRTLEGVGLNSFLQAGFTGAQIRFKASRYQCVSEWPPVFFSGHGRYLSFFQDEAFIK